MKKRRVYTHIRSDLLSAILIIIITIFLDQTSKYMAYLKLKDSVPINVIDNFFQLNFIENSGAAWGILKDQRYFFIVLTALIIISLASYMKLNKKLSKSSLTAIALVIGGAMGNLIDRIKMGYVIDFIDINFGSLYDFPVFNFADTFIVVGTFLMAYLLLTDKYEKPQREE